MAGKELFPEEDSVSRTAHSDADTESMIKVLEAELSLQEEIVELQKKKLELEKGKALTSANSRTSTASKQARKQ